MADNWNADASDNAGTNNGTELNSQGAMVAAMPEAERVKREEAIAAFKAEYAAKIERERKEKEEYAARAKAMGITLKEAKPVKPVVEKAEQVDALSKITAEYWQGTTGELSTRFFPEVRDEAESLKAYGHTAGFINVMLSLGIATVAGTRKTSPTGKGKRSNVYRLPLSFTVKVPLLEVDTVKAA